MITERQEKLLNFLVREYLTNAEPVGSLALKKVGDLDVSAATIRNDLQELTEAGYITQPHTSAGRIPTQKAYKYLADKLETPATFYDVQEVNVVRLSIVRQIKTTREEVEQEIRQMQEIMQILENDNLFEILNILDSWHKKMWN
jgi:heat-inducible transcriptional repressor